MAYYKKKEATGDEYVQATQEFFKYTFSKATVLPQRWEKLIILPLVESARKIRDLAVKANKIYINNSNKIEMKKGLEERVKYLIVALREMTVFNHNFEDLTSLIDTNYGSYKYMEQKIRKIIYETMQDDDKLKELKTEVIIHPSYIAINGKEFMELKLTHKNIEHWLYLFNEADIKLKEKVKKDRQTISRI